MKTDQGSARPSPRTSALYRQFFDHSPYGFFIARPGAGGGVHFPLSNRNAVTLLSADMCHEDSDYAAGLALAIKGIAVQVRNTENSAHIERQDKLRVDGSEQYVKTVLTPVYDEAGALTSVFGVIDAVSPKQCQEHLPVLREAEVGRIAERMGTGVVRFDHNCQRLYVNPYVAQAYGVDIAEITGKRPSEFPGGESGQRYEAAIREVFETGSYVEYCHDAGTGERNFVPSRLMLLPEWLPSGEVGTVLAIGQREDDHRDKLNLLCEAQALDELGMTAADVLLCFTPSGECSYRNEAAAKLLRDIGHKSPLHLEATHSTHPFIAASRSAIRRVVESGTPIERELWWTDEYERYRHYRFRYIPKHSLQGELTSIFAIASSLDEADSSTGPSKRAEAAQHEAVREEERRRIALEIHDELGQLLTALRFRIALLQPQLESGNRLIEKGLQEILGIIDRGGQEVQRIAANARPIKMSQGLKAALSGLIGDFSAHTGIACEAHIDDQEALDETRATVVFRIVQESLTNIARHSGARKAWLSLSRQLDRYQLKIEDNGNGFDMSAQRQRSFGLAGIRERVMLLKGDLFINSTPGKGTCIQISMPAAS